MKQYTNYIVQILSSASEYQFCRNASIIFLLWCLMIYIAPLSLVGMELSFFSQTISEFEPFYSFWSYPRDDSGQWAECLDCLDSRASCRILEHDPLSRNSTEGIESSFVNEILWQRRPLTSIGKILVKHFYCKHFIVKTWRRKFWFNTRDISFCKTREWGYKLEEHGRVGHTERKVTHLTNKLRDTEIL